LALGMVTSLRLKKRIKERNGNKLPWVYFFHFLTTSIRNQRTSFEEPLLVFVISQAQKTYSFP
jgi:hypothetical protein